LISLVLRAQRLIVTEMLLAILSICTQEELAESDESEGEAPSLEDVAARRQVIKNKILAVGRMQRVFQMLRFVSFFRPVRGCVLILVTNREEAENATELELPDAVPGSAVPINNALNVQGHRINKSIRTFDDA